MAAISRSSVLPPKGSTEYICAPSRSIPPTKSCTRYGNIRCPFSTLDNSVVIAFTVIGSCLLVLYSLASTDISRTNVCASPTIPAVVRPIRSSTWYIFLAALEAIKEPIVARFSLANTTPSLHIKPTVVVPFFNWSIISIFISYIPPCVVVSFTCFTPLKLIISSAKFFIPFASPFITITSKQFCSSK